jgi:hypothetical protein
MKLTDEQKIEICNKYKTGEYTLIKLANEYNVKYPTVSSILKVRKISLRKDISALHQKYTINQNYFDKIDTEEKAYFLGFLYADGYNNEKNK